MPDVRLINANALKEEIKHFKGLVPTGLIEYAQAVDSLIDNAPTVDKGYDFGYADGHGEGYELGKNSRPQAKDDLSCQYCKYDDKASTEYPCTICKNNHPNMFEWKEDYK